MRLDEHGNAEDALVSGQDRNAEHMRVMCGRHDFLATVSAHGSEAYRDKVPDQVCALYGHTDVPAIAAPNAYNYLP
jgi:hypothetical protein